MNTVLVRHFDRLRFRSESRIQSFSRRRRYKKALRHRARMAAIQGNLHALTYENCDPQDRSPLFTDLPGELRNEIFRHALVQYEDQERAYNQTSYFYRPGFRGPRKATSALLSTCKLVYLEARRVIMKEAEHSFWFCAFSY